MINKSAVTTLAIVPRDGIFVKDGRGWFTSSSNRARSFSWPMPSTIRGALRTALGRQIEDSQQTPLNQQDWPEKTESVSIALILPLRRQSSASGPWAANTRMWPAPADSIYFANAQSVSSLNPKPATLPTMGRCAKSDTDVDTKLAAARESLWCPILDTKEKRKPGPQWWSEAMFVDWLVGNVVPIDGPSSAPSALDLPRRIQVHVGIDPDTYAHKEEILYSTESIEFLQLTSDTNRSQLWQWAIGVHASGVGDTKSLLTVGGKQRTAFWEEGESGLFSIPNAIPDAFDKQKPKGIRLVLCSPTEFEHGWLPDGLNLAGGDPGEFRGEVVAGAGEWVLRAAIVPRAVHVSGWDMESHQPKPTRRLVPTGSVYFFEKADGNSFSGDDAHHLWLCRLGQSESQIDGFGTAVAGIWHPTNK